MPSTEVLQKLRPDRDLQCYFERPSAIAALSAAGPEGFHASGTWRQQFDWAVVEWNRDNVFEHPAFRNLPDGDLSGLTLSYDEVRTNCIGIDSDLFATVDWPSLRIWASSGGSEQLYRVPLKRHATPIEGSYQCASAEFELQGTATAGDYVGFAFLSEHHTHQLYFDDTIDKVIDRLVESVNTFSTVMTAERVGTSVIRLIYVGAGQTQANSTTGANGNRIGIYSFSSGSGSASWDIAAQQMSGGTSPSKWRIVLPFGSLTDAGGNPVPMNAVRKMRWTYSADLQSSAFSRSEFDVAVSNWTVTGSNRNYRVAGPGSRRIDDGDLKAITYSGTWSASAGNFSGATIRYCAAPGASLTCTYQVPQGHELFLGTRYADKGATVAVSVDGQTPRSIELRIPAEDVLARISLGQLSAGSHTVSIGHTGAEGDYFYFDFLEIAIPAEVLPSFPVQSRLTLATDWDTDHSIALAPERTAWMIHSLGFEGRVNHYVGALWFYELTRLGHSYSSATVTFPGTPEPNSITTLTIGRNDEPVSSQVVIEHLNLIGDTAGNIAKAFEMELNRGYTAIRAEVSGNVLTIYSRRMGCDGNHLTLAATGSESFTPVCSGSRFSGGVDGDWRTDLQAGMKLNRAVRDWCRSFYTAVRGYGMDVVAAFSTELQHGDPSPEAGIAQRYPNGKPVDLNTPAIQTNFSPTSLAFWKNIHLEMATVLQQAGVRPYLQFGEVQWWYFPYLDSGLPFYDAYTKDRFLATFGREISVILESSALPSQYPEEASFLPRLIGEFTSAIMSYVRSTIPDCRFEVLYPTDVNDTPFNRAVNFPSEYWTPAILDCLKTESFTYTYARNLDMAHSSMNFGKSYGFPPSKRSHLVGISDPIAPWVKEVGLARGEGVESVVLFALDQFCLIGYATPVNGGGRRSISLG
jgi:hypothetical protein